MKQQITFKQLAELDDKQLDRFHMAFYPPYYQLGVIDKKVLENKKASKIQITNENGTYVYIPKLGKMYALPNVGQMISFLMHGADTWLDAPEINKDLCDELWKMVKKEL